MSHPDPRHPAEADGALPYELPVRDCAITGTGTGMSGADTRQHEEWHHADPPPRGAGGWDAMREFGPPPDWTDEGVFIAGDGDRQPERDTGPASPASGTPRHYPARRLPARRAALTALVLLCITAITFVVVSRNHTIRISPADNPAATASQPTPGVAGRKHASVEASLAETAALGQGCRREHPGQLLAGEQHGQRVTVGRLAEDRRGGAAATAWTAGESTYQLDRVTDPANRQYTAFTAQNATYYIPRQPAGVYPRWFVARVTYANLAAPRHATGAGYVLLHSRPPRTPRGRTSWNPTCCRAHRAGSVHRDRLPRLRHRGQRIRGGGAERHVRADPGGDRRVPLDSSSAAVKSPGNLADLRDEAYFSGKLPAGSTDTDTHTTSGRVFALKTVGRRRSSRSTPTTHGAAHLGTPARPDLPGQHPRLLLLQPDPDVGHHRLRRAICHLYPAGPGEPADPRRRVRHHRTRVDDRQRVTGQQFPQLARGRPRIRRRLTRRMRG